MLPNYIKEDQLEVLAIFLCINLWTYKTKKNVFEEKKSVFNDFCAICNIEIDEVQEKLNQMKL